MKFRIKFKILILVVLLSVLILQGCGAKENVAISDTGFYFDTAVTITLYGENNRKYINKSFEICEYYENLFSKSVPTSDIARINSDSKTGIPTPVSEDTINLLQKSIDYSILSHGKFDISIGTLSTLWNFTGENPKVPDVTSITQCLSAVDYRYISIDVNNNTVMLTNPDTKIDAGGIAKGFIADKLKSYLISEGVRNGVINLGGNIVLLQEKPDGTEYTIGIQKPFGGKGDIITTLQTMDKSIVTSGVYERYFYENDKLYHHILDTDTGFPIENDLLAVTIISDSSFDGDALSTTCLALGYEEGMKLIESTKHVEAIFINSDYELKLSSGLRISDNIIHLTSRIY